MLWIVSDLKPLNGTQHSLCFFLSLTISVHLSFRSGFDHMVGHMGRFSGCRFLARSCRDYKCAMALSVPHRENTCHHDTYTHTYTYPQCTNACIKLTWWSIHVQMMPCGHLVNTSIHNQCPLIAKSHAVTHLHTHSCKHTYTHRHSTDGLCPQNDRGLDIWSSCSHSCVL